MLVPFTGTPTLVDRLNALEREIERLERIHQLTESKSLGLSWVSVRVVSRAALGGGLYWQFTNATTMQGNELTFGAVCTVGEGVSSLGQWCDWELRYYQQVPSIYSAAQKANRSASAHVVLASGRVNGTGGAGAVEQTVSAVVDISSYKGTYGRFEIWLGSSSDNFQERSYFSVRNLSFAD